MKLRLLVFILVFSVQFLFEACSSANGSADSAVSDLNLSKPSIKVLSLYGTIRSSIEGQDVTADCKLMLAGSDSASMTLLGPLGMLVGKLYARPDYFVFYNTLTSEAFEGVPNARNLNKILKVPLDFVEFAKLLKNEAPKDISKFSKTVLEDGNFLYKNTVDSSYVEYCLLNDVQTRMIQYQRKALDGSMIMNILFQDFRKINDFELPMKYLMKFPVMNGNVTIEVEDAEINGKIDKAFIFSAPKGFTKYILD